MDDVDRYLRRTRKTVLNDYKNPEGTDAASCSSIAVSVAQRLKASSREAYVVYFCDDEFFGPIVRNKALRPVMFAGRVTWNAHVVCCSEGFVYDPLMEGPTAIGLYADALLGEHVPYELLWSPDQVDEELRRRE